MPHPAPAPTTLPFALCLAAVMAASTALAAAAADWPQWRGINRDGRSPETGLLKQWPEGGPPLAWSSTGLGNGYSSVAVAGGRIYTLGDLQDSQYAIALDVRGGTTLWKTRIGKRNEMDYLGSRSTPTVAGDKVYVLGTEGDLLCLEAADGKVVWKRNLVQDFGGRMMQAQGSYDWRFSESPLVDGDRVIVTPGAKKAALVALEADSGEEIWRAAVPELGTAGTDGAGYSSVVISRGAGIKQYVQLLGRGVVGIDAATGKFLWGYNRIANNIANIPTPLVHGDYVFTSTGYGTGAALLKLSKARGGGVDATEVYFLPANDFQNHHGGMILHEGYVYTGTGHNLGFPLSLDMATGKIAWGPIRNAGNSSAAVAYADGNLYFRYQKGLVLLIEATPEGYREKGSFRIPDVKRESWPHPVISDGKLYLREQEKLYCYDLTPPPPRPKAPPKPAAAKPTR